MLRRYKLDELPELWNVLIGDMSLVGPRPDVPGYADRLTGEDRDVLRLRPGITGPASLKYANEEEILALVDDPQRYNDEVIFPDKVRINLQYYRSHSLAGDIRLIFATIFRSYSDTAAGAYAACQQGQVDGCRTGAEACHGLVERGGAVLASVDECRQFVLEGVPIKDRVAVTGRKPKAIIPVALYGMPYRIDRITEIADRHGIPVVEDAAEGLGSTSMWSSRTVICPRPIPAQMFDIR